jgi:glycosyltransferase involved in cell wall biosynthesis
VRILLAAEDFPWPSTGGGLIRLAKMIEALSELGEMDLFTLYDPNRTDPVLPSGLAVNRLLTVRYPASSRQRRWRPDWLTQRGLPVEVVMRSSDRSPRTAFDSWASDRYDLVWFSTAAVFSWLGRPQLGPTIIDLMDLEDVKARQRAALLRDATDGHGMSVRIRQVVASLQARKNANDWRGLQHSVARRVERVVLCSEADVRRSGLPNAVAIPNAYPRPAHSVGHLTPAEPPTILLQGSLNYAPNMDAVDWLVGEVEPLLRARVPDVRIRLVGKPTPGVERRNRPPEVTVVGRVETMEPELARADIAVVPLRIGSGTRLKILESFAHRIPVVSTSLGADGLDVEDGVHLLIADGAEAFADACQRLLTDVDLRKRLVDAAEARFLERYEWSAAKLRAQELARAIAGGSGTTGGPVGTIRHHGHP